MDNIKQKRTLCYVRVHSMESCTYRNTMIKSIRLVYYRHLAVCSVYYTRSSSSNWPVFYRSARIKCMFAELHRTEPITHKKGLSFGPNQTVEVWLVTILEQCDIWFPELRANYSHCTKSRSEVKTNLELIHIYWIFLKSYKTSHKWNSHPLRTGCTLYYC